MLEHAAAALRRAAARLDEAAFDDAVERVVACRGRLVLLGAGTSGIVSRKVAATLTSTGTPASFVHPSDALHGGLGAVTPDDIVIAVSNSGETDELLVLLPTLRRRGVPIVTIVGNPASTLAKAADVVLDASIDAEAGWLGLAPTTSTTVALSLGDALAVAVAERKGLTPEDFALNHPSGRLGRRLTLTVRDLMHKAVGCEVALAAGWLDILAAISKGGLGAAVVVDNHRLAGIITDGDLRRALERNAAAGVGDLVPKDLMTAQPVCVSPDVLAYDALRLMEDRPSQISVLPVVEGDRCVGLVRVHDLVRAGL